MDQQLALLEWRFSSITNYNTIMNEYKWISLVGSVYVAGVVIYTNGFTYKGKYKNEDLDYVRWKLDDICMMLRNWENIESYKYKV